MTTETATGAASTKGARSGMVTAREIEAASNKAKADGKDVWLTDPGARGQGRFTVRCTAAGARVCMYRHTRADGTRDILKVADYDPRGASGMTLHEAREKAGEFARIAAGGNNLRAIFTEKIQAEVQAQEVAAATKRRAEGGSLEALMRVYVGTLKGRQSHDDAESIFRLHVSEPFPELVKRAAANVKAEQLRDVLARLIDAGKGRTAAKLRAYLRAAYGLAMRASLDPTIPEALTAFDVESNPADRLPSLAQFSKALDRALTLPELNFFWKRVEASPTSAARDALIACLLLGGQRPTQLLRSTPRDVDRTAAMFTLFDIKGRNRHSNPRRHVLPILADLMPVIQWRLDVTEEIDAPLFSSTGRVALREETVAALVDDIEGAMLKAGELERGPFSMRDLRRTAETHMAALGISSDVRAQIQSHGLGGIQARHYDRHDYMPEKRAALALWVQRLKGVVPVAPMKRKTRTARPRSVA